MMYFSNLGWDWSIIALTMILVLALCVYKVEIDLCFSFWICLSWENNGRNFRVPECKYNILYFLKFDISTSE